MVKFHRFILPEIGTHRIFSKNVASSRAIPVRKLLEMAELDPAMPLFWGKNQPGMSAAQELEGEALEQAKDAWNKARLNAIESAKHLFDLGLHKQTANRLLEPFVYTTAIVSATDFRNFYALRTSKETVQPEMFALATMMLKAQRESEPVTLSFGEWHLPLVKDGEVVDLELAKKCSVARCARVSYLLTDGTNPSLEKDVDLHDKLLKSHHMSPFEHQATPLTGVWGNFRNWRSYRKYIPNECQDFDI